MTFKEAVEKLRSMGLSYSTVEYEHKFHAPGRESTECTLYTERHGVIFGKGKTWEEAFLHLDQQINGVKPSDAEAPEHDVSPPSARAKEDADVPF